MLEVKAMAEKEPRDKVYLKEMSLSVQKSKWEMG